MSCSDPATNQLVAQGMVGTRLYAPVDVTIVNVAGSQVKLVVKGSGAHVVEWGDLDIMWSPCPSTVAPNATPANLKGKPNVGDGSLYLSQDFLTKNNIATIDPKWPTRLAVPPAYLPLRLFPTSIHLMGVELADENGFTPAEPIDLLDPNLVDPDQEIRLSGGAITLNVSQAVFERFHVPFQAAVDGAIAAIEEKQDPDKIAAAWKTIGAAVRELRRTDSSQLRIRPDQTAKLKALLPSVDLP